jgi:hypothetical protein
MNPKDLLEHVRRKPGMYWGQTEHPFTSLCAFVSGVQVGGGPCLVPEGFAQFVAQRLRERWPTGKGTMSFIRDHTASEQEAFEFFFQLLDEYETKKA